MPKQKQKPVAIMLALGAMFGGLVGIDPIDSQARELGKVQVLLGSPAAAQQPAHQAKRKTNATVAVTIRPLVDEVQVGDAIPIEFTISNESSKGVVEYLDCCYDESGRMWEYQLVVQTEAGEKLSNFEEVFILEGPLVTKQLQPQGRFTTTVVLNRWAPIRVPGRYRVTGIYKPLKFSGKFAEPIPSESIWITVKPRTGEEMGAYISGLQRRLELAVTPEERRAILERLAYTCSPEILPILLKTWYEADSGYWEAQALSFYVPRSELVNRRIMEVAAQRGLPNGMQAVLARYKVTPEEMFPLIVSAPVQKSP